LHGIYYDVAYGTAFALVERTIEAPCHVYTTLRFLYKHFLSFANDAGRILLHGLREGNWKGEAGEALHMLRRGEKANKKAYIQLQVGSFPDTSLAHEPKAIYMRYGFYILQLFSNGGISAHEQCRSKQRKSNPP